MHFETPMAIVQLPPAISLFHQSIQPLLLPIGMIATVNFFGQTGIQRTFTGILPEFYRNSKNLPEFKNFYRNSDRIPENR